MLHPKSGGRYVLQTIETPRGVVYRAVGPLHHRENPTEQEALQWLDAAGADAYDDGEWLAQEIG